MSDYACGNCGHPREWHPDDNSCVEDCYADCPGFTHLTPEATESRPDPAEAAWAAWATAPEQHYVTNLDKRSFLAGWAARGDT